MAVTRLKTIASPVITKQSDDRKMLLDKDSTEVWYNGNNDRGDEDEL